MSSEDLKSFCEEHQGNYVILKRYDRSESYRIFLESEIQNNRICFYGISPKTGKYVGPLCGLSLDLVESLSIEKNDQSNGQEEEE